MTSIKMNSDSANRELLILVDENDQELGLMDKLQVHQKGLLHRAFSILIFDDNGKMLLQRRALSKYHSPGLWTNACCSHPTSNINLMEAANIRLEFEMGMKCQLKVFGHFIYKCNFDNGLIEHEYDYILVGVSNQIPKVNTDEAMDFKYMSVVEIKNDVKTNPNNYTFWFKEIIQNYSNFQL